MQTLFNNSTNNHLNVKSNQEYTNFKQWLQTQDDISIYENNSIISIIENMNYFEEINNSRLISFDTIDSWHNHIYEYAEYKQEYDRLDFDQKKFITTALEHTRGSILFLTGPGGSGKSNAVKILKKRLGWYHTARKICNFIKNDNITLGKVIVRYVQSLSEKTIIIAAPTGMAANGINGETFHKALGMRPKIYEYDSNSPLSFKEYVKDKMLQSKKCKKCESKKEKCLQSSPLYLELKNNIKTIILDEVSMISAYTLDVIDRYLQHIQVSRVVGNHSNTRLEYNYYNAPQPKCFGGIQIILMGDLCQLPPVCNEKDKDDNCKMKNLRKKDPFYKSDVINLRYRTNLQLLKTLNVPNLVINQIGANINILKFVPIVLQGRYRFINDTNWGEVLERIRYNELNEQDINTIISNESIVNKNYAGSLQKTIHIAPTRHQCTKINNNNLQKLTTYYEKISYRIQKYDQESEELNEYRNGIIKDLEIPSVLELSLGSRVIITKNIMVYKIEWCVGLECPITSKKEVSIKKLEKIQIVNGTRGSVYGAIGCNYWAIDHDGKVITNEDGSYRINQIKNAVYVNIAKDELNDDPIIVQIVPIEHKENSWKYANIDEKKFKELSNEIDVKENIFSYNKYSNEEPTLDALVIDTNIKSKANRCRNHFDYEKCSVIGVIDNIDFIENTITLNHAAKKIINKTISLDSLPKSYKFHSRKIVSESVTLFKYIPLNLGWAITIHKSQGMSLDSVVMHPHTNDKYYNSHGTFYVATSRVRNMDGLKIAIENHDNAREYIKSWSYIDPEIVKFYRNIDEHYNNPKHNDEYKIPSTLSD